MRCVFEFIRNFQHLNSAHRSHDQRSRASRRHKFSFSILLTEFWRLCWQRLIRPGLKDLSYNLVRVNWTSAAARQPNWEHWTFFDRTIITRSRELYHFIVHISGIFCWLESFSVQVLKWKSVRKSYHKLRLVVLVFSFINLFAFRLRYWFFFVARSHFVDIWPAFYILLFLISIGFGSIANSRMLFLSARMTRVPFIFCFFHFSIYSDERKNSFDGYE